MELTSEQNFVLQELLKVNKRITTCGGYAGTGKTTLVQKLSQKLSSWAVCAYTGKAAEILRRKGIEEASTIHSLIYVPKKDSAGNLILDKNGNPIFILNDHLEIGGFIVDEASMVSKEIYDDLLTFKKPIIFVGDHGQLKPIGTDIYVMQDPDYKLETIHRNAGEIAHFGEYIRKGNKPSHFSYKNKKCVEFISKVDAFEYSHKVEQVICAFNKTRVQVNQTARKNLGLKGDFPVVGDKIICLRNNKLSKVFNGMQGVVEHLYDKPKNKMRFKTHTESIDIFFDPSQFNKEKYNFSLNREDPDPVDFCYGTTCHKSQGDEYEDGIVIEQKCDLWDHVRWAYTAATRFKSKVFWAC